MTHSVSAMEAARALRAIKALSLQHHAHEDPAVLLHALLVEIPAAIDEEIAALRATPPAQDGGPPPVKPRRFA